MRVVADEIGMCSVTSHRHIAVESEIDDRERREDGARSQRR